MKNTLKTFLKKSFMTSVVVMLVSVCTMSAWSAPKPGVSKSGRAPSTVTSKKTTIKASSVKKKTAKEEPVAKVETEPEPEPIPEPEVEEVFEEPIIVDNKTSNFDSIISELDDENAPDASEDARAEKIRQQRALLDAKDNAINTKSAIGAASCDAGLRKCMSEKCDKDFSKCAKDGENDWTNKLNACRDKTQCTAHEFALLAPEIKADRDMAIEMSFYDSVLSCGERYNKCIFENCGAKLNKCISKTDGDRVISKCDAIAKECKQQDSGIASRVMSVFGTLRQEAKDDVLVNEKRLYELRDLMRKQCNKFGAMFDERTLDCVYTVNFFVGEDRSTPTASKKLYSGDIFQCTPNWFGIDVTTYKENAYRLTRSEKGASSAALGAGVGTATGMVTSGAIGRAVKDKGMFGVDVSDGFEGKGGEIKDAFINGFKKNGGGTSSTSSTSTGGGSGGGSGGSSGGGSGGSSGGGAK